MGSMDWKRIYGMLERATPLPFDCGRLCGKRCCSGIQTGRGVYLFPGEEKLFAGESTWCTVEEFVPEEVHFTGGGFLLNCCGDCPRSMRPLSCRLFPLAPRLHGQGNFDLIFEPDAVFTCPLVQLNDIDMLDPAFIEGARMVWLELVKDERVWSGLQEYMARLKREETLPWTRLL